MSFDKNQDIIFFVKWTTGVFINYLIWEEGKFIPAKTEQNKTNLNREFCSNKNKPIEVKTKGESIASYKPELCKGF